jgi:hydroxymethylglutaryl-CoA lyase
VPVNVSLSCVFGCPMEGEVPVETVMGWTERFAALGVQGITLCDTTGMAFPTQVQALCAQAIARQPALAFTAHFHNTRAMGGVNTVAAIEAGIRRFDMSLGGIGGCPYAPGASGNVATEDIVHMLECMDYDTGLDLAGLIEAAGVLEGLIEHPLPAQVSRAGVRLTRHPPPPDFDRIAARAHGREADGQPAEGSA